MFQVTEKFGDLWNFRTVKNRNIEVETKGVEYYT